MNESGKIERKLMKMVEFENKVMKVWRLKENKLS